MKLNYKDFYKAQKIPRQALVHVLGFFIFENVSFFVFEKDRIIRFRERSDVIPLVFLEAYENEIFSDKKGTLNQHTVCCKECYHIVLGHFGKLVF